MNSEYQSKQSNWESFPAELPNLIFDHTFLLKLKTGSSQVNIFIWRRYNTFQRRQTIIFKYCQALVPAIHYSSWFTNGCALRRRTFNLLLGPHEGATAVVWGQPQHRGRTGPSGLVTASRTFWLGHHSSLFQCGYEVHWMAEHRREMFKCGKFKGL
jgi:hypothetical protein